MEEHIDVIYKQIHQNTNIRVKIQLLFLIFQIQNQVNSFSDRFFRIIYDTLLDANLPNSTSIDIFFDVLLVSLQKDSHPNRIISIIKRLLQLTLISNQAFTATALIVVSKLLTTHSSLKQYIQPTQLSSNLADEEEENFKDVDMPVEENENKTPKTQTKDKSLDYNPTNRDPKYSNA